MFVSQQFINIDYDIEIIISYTVINGIKVNLHHIQ